MTTATSGAPPRRARSIRNVALWAAAIIGSAVLIALAGANRGADTYLDPEGHGPSGIAALVAVLEDHGVDVTTATTLVELRTSVAALANPGQATVALGDSRILTRDGAAELERIVRGVHRLVLLDGGSSVLGQVAPQVNALPAQGQAPIDASCQHPVARDGAMVGRFDTRFVTDDGSVTSCYPLKAGDDIDHGALLAVLPQAGDVPETYAVGFGHALTNRRIVDDGHAALGLRLLGADPHLIVYTPSLTDTVAVSGAHDEGPELPAWLVPGLALAAVALLGYAVASGRRLGRLVPEPLPVVVKASETTHSRAALYRSARDVARAAAVLRDGTLQRLRVRLRLDRQTPPAEVASALGAHGIPPADVAALTDPDPTTEVELVRLARALSALEEKVNPT